MPDINQVTLIRESSDQAILVAANVKDHKIADLIGRPERPLHVGEALEPGSLNGVVPPCERLDAGWFVRGGLQEFANLAPGDDGVPMGSLSSGGHSSFPRTPRPLLTS